MDRATRDHNLAHLNQSLKAGRKYELSGQFDKIGGHRETTTRPSNSRKENFTPGI